MSEVVQAAYMPCEKASEIVNEIGNAIRFRLFAQAGQTRDGDDGGVPKVVVHAFGPTSKAIHGWTADEARELHRLLSFAFPAIPWTNQAAEIVEDAARTWTWEAGEEEGHDYRLKACAERRAQWDDDDCPQDGSCAECAGDMHEYFETPASKERRRELRALAAKIRACSPRPAKPTDGLALAMQFHEIYERLAPSFGYETRTETREFDPTTPNGRLMAAVCAEVLTVLTKAGAL